MSIDNAEIAVPHECRETIRTGALVALNHSGGKDSQAMTILLSRIVPRAQLVAVHAPLGEVEWPGTVEHIEATLPSGVPLILAPVASGKTLLDSIEERGRFPSPSVRWCTSSLKRGPIERELRPHLKANLRFHGRIVSAMGMRAKESPARARKSPWRLNERNSRAGRTWFDWLPIFDLTERQVFRVIRDAGQSPHPAYAMGMSRLSSVFCIMASRNDLRTAAQQQPALYRRHVAVTLMLRRAQLAPASLDQSGTTATYSALRGDRAPHRPHPVALRHSLAGTHGRFPVRGRRRRGRDGSRPHPIPARADAATPRTAEQPQASVSEEWSGAGVRVNPGAR